MPLADFIKALPAADIPIPPTRLTTHAMQSPQGLVIFFTAHEDIELPPHSHKGQWGVLLEGKLELTIEGQTRTIGPGEHYDIPSGAVHSARLAAGSTAMDVFEEPDRYALKA